MLEKVTINMIRTLSVFAFFHRLSWTKRNFNLSFVSFAFHLFFVFLGISLDYWIIASLLNLQRGYLKINAHLLNLVSHDLKMSHYFLLVAEDILFELMQITLGAELGPVCTIICTRFNYNYHLGILRGL